MISQIEYEGFPAFRLYNEAVELIVVPGIGGKIVSLKHPDGREWLWRNPYLSQRRAEYGESFVELHDTGGWDECFPTTNPCTVDGIDLPDHGELVTQCWSVEDFTPTSIRLSVAGVRMPYRFEREIRLVENRVEIHYQVENRSSRDLPFMWCCHPLFTLDPDLSIHLPRTPKARLSYSATGDFQAGTEFTWPDLNGQILQSFPRSEKMGLKIFAGPLDEGWVTLKRVDESLMFWFDLDSISHVALWINNGAWSGCGSEPYYNLGLEPCIGPFDALDETDQPPLLRAFETRNWTLRLAFQRI